MPLSGTSYAYRIRPRRRVITSLGNIAWSISGYRSKARRFFVKVSARHGSWKQQHRKHSIPQAETTSLSGKPDHKQATDQQDRPRIIITRKHYRANMISAFQTNTNRHVRQIISQNTQPDADKPVRVGYQDHSNSMVRNSTPYRTITVTDPIIYHTPQTIPAMEQVQPAPEYFYKRKQKKPVIPHPIPLTDFPEAFRTRSKPPLMTTMSGIHLPPTPTIHTIFSALMSPALPWTTQERTDGPSNPEVYNEQQGRIDVLQTAIATLNTKLNALSRALDATQMDRQNSSAGFLLPAIIQDVPHVLT